MSDQMQQLPACPACGGVQDLFEDAVENWYAGHQNGQDFNAVVCLNCGYTSLYASQKALESFRKAAQRRQQR